MKEYYGYLVTNGKGFIGYDSGSGGHPYMTSGMWGAHIFDTVDEAKSAIENDRHYLGAKNVWVVQIFVEATQ